MWRLLTASATALTLTLVSCRMVPVLAAPATPVPGAALGGGSAATDAVYKALEGPWVGALEYRDYSSNERVDLPTIVHIRRAKDAKSLSFHYIYDDGPTKVVEDLEMVTITPTPGTYTTVSGDGKDTSTDRLTGLEDFTRSGQGRLVRLGQGKENGKPVDVRTTLDISPRTLTILKETRAAGQAFLFRDQYNLTRVAAR